MTIKKDRAVNEILDGDIMRESLVASFAGKMAKISRYGGWFVLIAFLLGPPRLLSEDVQVELFFILALPVGLSAAALRWWSFGYVREKHFVVNGPYRYVRNPVELSCLLGYVAGGVFLALPGWYVFSLVALMALYMSFVSISYEKMLLRRHASKYVRYMNRVRRWFPLSLPATNSEKQDFSIGRGFSMDKPGWTWAFLYLVVFSLRSRWSFDLWQNF